MQFQILAIATIALSLAAPSHSPIAQDDDLRNEIRRSALGDPLGALSRYRDEVIPELLRNGDIERAALVAEQLLLNVPQFPESSQRNFSRIAEACIAAGRETEALRFASLGFLLARPYNLYSALDPLEAAIDASEGSSAVFSFRAQLVIGGNSQIGDRVFGYNMLSAYEIAKKLEGNWYGAYVSRGNLYLAAGLPDEALAEFRSAMSKAPRGREEEAVENVARAIRLLDRDVGRSNILLGQPSLEESIEYIDQNIK